MCGPRPSARARSRSSRSSTSWRSVARSPSTSRAPASRWAAREPGPKRGSNSASGAAYSVVPVPSASATNARAVGGDLRQRLVEVGGRAAPAGRRTRPPAAGRPATRGLGGGQPRLALRSPATPVGDDGAAGVGEPSRERASSVTTSTAATRGVARQAEHGVEGERRGQLAPGRRRSARPAGTCRRPVASPAPGRRTPAHSSGRSCQARAGAECACDSTQGRDRVACTRRGASGRPAQASTRDERDGSQAAAERGWAFTLARPHRQADPARGDSRDWIDGEKIPATGGCIVVVNHISHVDPLLAAHFVYDHGRLPRYLAKSGLFKNKALGGFLTRRRPDPGRAAQPQRRRGVRRRGGRGARRRVRGRLPRGHAHPRPRPVADDRQDRRRADRAGDRLPGDPGRPVGRAGGAAAVRQEAAAVPAQARSR